MKNQFLVSTINGPVTPSQYHFSVMILEFIQKHFSFKSKNNDVIKFVLEIKETDKTGGFNYDFFIVNKDKESSFIEFKDLVDNKSVTIKNKEYIELLLKAVSYSWLSGLYGDENLFIKKTSNPLIQFYKEQKEKCIHELFNKGMTEDAEKLLFFFK